MALRDILVHLDGTDRARDRLRSAVELARYHGAHLAGLYVAYAPTPSLSVPEPGSGRALAEMAERLRREARAEAAPVEAAFLEATRSAGVEGEWRVAEGAPPLVVALHARYADLAIVGQEEPGRGSPAGGAVAEELLFASGRPGLVLPHAGVRGAVGRRVLIGWNASREAARAVAAALPLLVAAEVVTVLVANPRSGIAGLGAGGPGADLARHLERHGVRAGVDRVASDRSGDAAAILRRAAELSADLLVMGAYGHSRLRDLVLGGVTRTVLREMALPVLMAH